MAFCYLLSRIAHAIPTLFPVPCSLAEGILLIMLKALIFDFDGLILDTEYPEYLRWHRVFKEYGLDLPIGEWSAGIGKGSDSLTSAPNTSAPPTLTPYDALEYRLARPIDREEIRERGRRYFAELMEKERVLPGVVDLMDLADRGADLMACHRLQLPAQLG